MLTLLLLAATLGWVFSATPSRAHTWQDESLPDIEADEKLGTRLLLPQPGALFATIVVDICLIPGRLP